MRASVTQWTKAAADSATPPTFEKSHEPFIVRLSTITQLEIVPFGAFVFES